MNVVAHASRGYQESVIPTLWYSLVLVVEDEVPVLRILKKLWKKATLHGHGKLVKMGFWCGNGTTSTNIKKKQ
jgi:hypothetical protein